MALDDLAVIQVQLAIAVHYAITELTDVFITVVEIQYAIAQFNPNFPQYELELDVEKAKMAGFTTTDLFSALQGYYGGIYATDFNKFGKQYRVMIQAKPEDRADENSLNQIFVRNSSGQTVAVSEFVNLKKIYGPEVVERFNLLSAVRITGVPSVTFTPSSIATSLSGICP